MKLVKKRIKIELTVAIVLAFSVLISVVFFGQPRHKDAFYGILATSSFQSKAFWESSNNIRQIVKENTEGELKKGSFELVIEGLRNSTFHYGGRIPYLNMIYENELWRGWLNCKIPTENVTLFTFDARKLINNYGKVIRIDISVTEIEINQTGHPEEQFSEVRISLKEFVEGESPILSQLGTAVSDLIVALAWIAQGVIIGVPLCFALLGVIMLVDRAILPIWKKQFKGKGLQPKEPYVQK